MSKMTPKFTNDVKKVEEALKVMKNPNSTPEQKQKAANTLNAHADYLQDLGLAMSAEKMRNSLGANYANKPNTPTASPDAPKPGKRPAPRPVPGGTVTPKKDDEGR